MHVSCSSLSIFFFHHRTGYPKFVAGEPVSLQSSCFLKKKQQAHFPVSLATMFLQLIYVLSTENNKILKRPYFTHRIFFGKDNYDRYLRSLFLVLIRGKISVNHFLLFCISILLLNCVNYKIVGVFYLK